ncbi:MAG: hypothetical protein PHR83_08000 [Paludibacter sp.]|nr:hypothetical protein [Paludibacter sp.]
MIKETETSLIIEIPTQKPKEVLKEIQKALADTLLIFEKIDCEIEPNLNVLKQLLLFTIQTPEQQIEIFKNNEH